MVSLFNRCVPFIPHDSLCPGVTTTVTGYYYLFSVENAPREQPEVNFQWCCGQRMLIFNQMVGINYCSIATNTHIYMYLCIVCLRTKAITNDQRYLESIEWLLLRHFSLVIFQSHINIFNIIHNMAIPHSIQSVKTSASSHPIFNAKINKYILVNHTGNLSSEKKSNASTIFQKNLYVVHICRSLQERQSITSYIK